ncbi:MAG: transposase [Deltaproteobacteria bacterium]|nr:transposase [Deltaproteobacteria bacterium]
MFVAVEPLTGKRDLKITESRTRLDWAHFIKDVLSKYDNAEKITLVMDNLNTHVDWSLYSAFPPEEARKLVSKLDICYTRKHGSWLNHGGN